MTECIWTDPNFAPVTRLLSARTGLFFRAHNRDGVEQGIRLAMQRSGLTSLVEYYHRLQNDVGLLDDLICELTVGETYFFREAEQLDFIRDTILPDLLMLRDFDHIIRVWSAGCASGEEAYSLAMLMDRFGLAGRSHILATDVSCEALAKAREAVYPDWSLRGQGKHRTQRYLKQHGDLFEVDQSIRRQVDFEFLNLAIDIYPSVVSGTRDLDLILCRNVLIYFDEETIQSIAAKFHACLADGGWLITGSGDPALDGFAPYETVLTDAGVVYRRAASSVRSDQYPTPTAGAGHLPVWSNIHQPSAPCSETVAIERPVTPALAQRSAQPPPAQQCDVVVQARQALREGKYQQAVDLTAQLANDEEVCEIQVQALANINVSRAELVCANAGLLNPTSASLQYLHAVLLIENNRDDEAAVSVRRAIYLDRNLVVAHLLLGSILRRRGHLSEARKSYRNARCLCEAQPPNVSLRLAEGETAAQLAQAAQFQMDSINALMEAAG